MADISFDAANSADNGTGATTLTYSLTCTGPNSYISGSFVVGSSTDHLSSLAYAGTAIIPSSRGNLTTGYYGYTFIAPTNATGSNNIIITLDTSLVIVSAAASYTNVSGIGVSTGAITTASSINPSLVNTRNGAWNVLATANDSDITTLFSTIRTNDHISGFAAAILDGGGPDSIGSNALDARTSGGGAADWIYEMNELLPIPPLSGSVVLIM